MPGRERRSRLIDIIRLRGFAALDELVRELGVSESTIRRDLDALEEQGTARRTHGGVLYAGGLPRIAEFDEKQPANWEAKRTIAAATAEIIDDEETVLLDGGTTTYEGARLLAGRSLQVVTNSCEPICFRITNRSHITWWFCITTNRCLPRPVHQ